MHSDRTLSERSGENGPKSSCESAEPMLKFKHNNFISAAVHVEIFNLYMEKSFPQYAGLKGAEMERSLLAWTAE